MLLNTPELHFDVPVFTTDVHLKPYAEQPIIDGPIEITIAQTIRQLVDLELPEEPAGINPTIEDITTSIVEFSQRTQRQITRQRFLSMADELEKLC